MIKTVALIFFVLVSLVLGGLLLRDQEQITQRVAQVASLQTEVARQRAVAQKSTADAAKLAEKRTQLLARARAAEQSLGEAQAASQPSPDATASATPAKAVAAGTQTSNPFSESLSKMLKDPATKKMMRATQGVALRQLYDDLVKKWALSPEETSTFYDLLLDKQSADMDRGMEVLEKGVDSTSQTPAADPEAKIKASLGDDLFQQYKEYEKTLGGRLTLNQLQQQLATSNIPALTPDQSNALLQTITEEQTKQPPPDFASRAGQGGNPFVLDSAQVDQFVQRQGTLNDQIDARMAGTLSAPQLQALKDQQQQMLSMQKMGMEMAAKMMGPSPTP